MTGQPTASGLGSGQPTLRHQEVPGPSAGADRESASAAAEEDNLGGHHEKDKQAEETGTQGVASLDRGIGAGLFPEARPREITPRVRNR